MGKRIRDLRQRRALTQLELAEPPGSESALRSYKLGEITEDDCRDWKDAYQPRILIDPVIGEEVDNPYTGHCLEGAEREGTRRAVRTMWWLNGDEPRP